MAYQDKEYCAYLQKKAEYDAIGYIGNALAWAANRYDHRTVIWYDAETISFRTLYHQAVTCSYVLRAHGVVRDSRVILLLDNTPDFYRFYYGVWQLGALVVPVNTLLSPHEYTHIINDAAPVLIVTTPERKATCIAQAPHIPVVTSDDIDYHSPEGDVASFVVCQRDPHAVCALLYTSGTTGMPKGVMLTSDALLTNNAQMAARLGITDGVGHRIFAALPLFHIFAQSTCVWAPFLLGAGVILVEKIERRRITDALIHKPTVVLGVPSLYALFCLMGNLCFSSVDYFISGADALPDKIRRYFALVYGRKIAVGYGLTEASPVVAFDIIDALRPSGSIGRPLPGLTVVLLDTAGNHVTGTEIGEIVVHGPTNMTGYYNAPDATAQVLKNGYLYTGDLGQRLADGTVVIVGRIKDTIKHKGVNIYPQEIEAVLMMHDAVLRAAVVGKSIETDGEIPVAYVQLKEALVGVDDLLRALCSQYLAPYKIPKEFICTTDPLPLTATGKVDKKILRVRVHDKSL